MLGSTLGFGRFGFAVWASIESFLVFEDRQLPSPCKSFARLQVPAAHLTISYTFYTSFLALSEREAL